jgi:hypothetical protein
MCFTVRSVAIHNAYAHRAISIGRNEKRPLTSVVEQVKWQTDGLLSLAVAIRFEPAPFATRGTMPKRRRVSGIRHDRQASTAVEPNRHHRDVLPAAEFCANDVI